MRCRVTRLFGVASLSLLLALWVSGCSGQQQQEEGLEVTQGNEAEEGAANAAAEEGENTAAAEGNAIEDLNSGNLGEEGGSTGANATESDLQEIISEMNSQQQSNAAVADAAMGGDQAAAPPLMANNPAPDPMMNAMPASPAPMNSAPAAAAQGVQGAQGAQGAPTASTGSVPFQPGGTPAGQGLPEIGSKMPYIVQNGDTLGKISTKIYGSPNRWNELAKLSGLSNPSRIYPGDLVYYTLDESAVAFATAYETVQRSEATVQPGDTLATIAQRVYGSPKAWKSIWRQNDNISNPDVLASGTTVYYIANGALTAAINKVKVELAQSLKTNTNKIKKNIEQIEQNITNDIAEVSKTNSFNLAKGQMSYDALMNEIGINLALN